jgi:transcriptional regulator with XRE-family HTH domain
MTGSQLRRLRQAQNQTQKAAAQMLGVAANTVARWERGELPVPHWVDLLIAAQDQLASQEGEVLRFLRNLRKTIQQKRAAAHALHYERKWNSDAVLTLEVVKLVDWIEAQLDTLPE